MSNINTLEEAKKLGVPCQICGGPLDWKSENYCKKCAKSIGYPERWGFKL